MHGWDEKGGKEMEKAKKEWQGIEWKAGHMLQQIQFSGDWSLCKVFCLILGLLFVFFSNELYVRFH